MSPAELWRFLPVGYLLTILVETPILLLGLSPVHTFKRKLFAGIWLTACTYPIVVLVLPLLFHSTSEWSYLIVAETFAPVAECALFWLAFDRDEQSRVVWRDCAVIVLANLASFAVGEVLNAYGWFGIF
jgi:hypothetical protein